MKQHRFLLAALIVTSLTCGLFGQSVLHCNKDGTWLPVDEIKGGRPYCFTGDDLVKGDKDKLTLLPTADFGQGFIDVKVLQNVREGVTNSDGILRFTSERSWYFLKAKIVADRDLENCYYAMRFQCYGMYSYYCRPLGDLQAGKPKTIEIFMKLNYEMPQQLHIFSGMEEIRTSLVPEAYTYDFGKFTVAAR